MKAITTITTGETIKRTQIYHLDNREMIGTFKVLGKTKGGRFRIETKVQYTNSVSYTHLTLPTKRIV